MKSYNHLTKEQRYTISVCLREKMSLSRIANLINVSKSTVSREIKRNSNMHRHYVAIDAQQFSELRKKFPEDRGNCQERTGGRLSSASRGIGLRRLLSASGTAAGKHVSRLNGYTTLSGETRTEEGSSTPTFRITSNTDDGLWARTSPSRTA